MYLNADRQGCVVKTVAYSLRTDRHTQGQTKRTEGPMVLSNDIFNFKTVIIGGPITLKSKQLLDVPFNE